MTTQTRPDVDLLESLDFEPVCEHFSRCNRPASWLGWTSPCKCITSYMCHEHKVLEERLISLQVAPGCNACDADATIAWRPL